MTCIGTGLRVAFLSLGRYHKASITEEYRMEINIVAYLRPFSALQSNPSEAMSQQYSMLSECIKMVRGPLTLDVVCTSWVYIWYRAHTLISKRLFLLLSSTHIYSSLCDFQSRVHIKGHSNFAMVWVGSLQGELLRQCSFLQCWVNS